MNSFALASTSRVARVGAGPVLQRVRAAAARRSRPGRRPQGLLVDLGRAPSPTGRSRYELVIALGRDGTILRALRLAMTPAPGVLGGNFGHVGPPRRHPRRRAEAAALERITRRRGATWTAPPRSVAESPGRAGPPRDHVQRHRGRAACRASGLLGCGFQVGGVSIHVHDGDGIVIASPDGLNGLHGRRRRPRRSRILDAMVTTPLATQGGRCGR